MNSALPLLQGLLALSVLLALLAVTAAAAKLQRAGRLRRRSALEAAARPHVLRVLADDAAAAHEPALTRGQRRAFEELAISLLPKLRGTDRDALVSALERRGALDRARRRATRRGAVGRARAAELLGDAGDQEALLTLVALLDDRDRDVRIVAARALGKLGHAAVAPLLTALDGRRPLPAAIATMALVHAGAAGGDDLIAGLDRARSPRVRAVAAELLGQLGVLGAADALATTLACDPDPDTQAAAARSLGRLGLPSGLEPLRAAVDAVTAPEGVRASAARALGRIGGATAVAALNDLLHCDGTGHELARAAADGLASCGAAGRAALEQASAHPVAGPAAREALARVALRSPRPAPAVAA